MLQYRSIPNLTNQKGDGKVTRWIRSKPEVAETESTTVIILPTNFEHGRINTGCECIFFLMKEISS